MRKIDMIIVHCSATPAGRNVSVEEIDRWHRERGFDCIGYHYVVGLDGTVYTGRPAERAGAHCKGYNTRSIGVCYIGGVDAAFKPSDTRTDEQKKALRLLLTELRHRFNGAEVRSHGDFAAKACPCFDATAEYSDLP
ncbi:MAG: N-acetylmuramoyl-L-alanine amidase [Muribaculaceae bacterium]|nr:N-acetylmuramoyl-L-alanine amidase [Muribaculaceae bacterium]